MLINLAESENKGRGMRFEEKHLVVLSCFYSVSVATSKEGYVGACVLLVIIVVWSVDVWRLEAIIFRHL
jgi:hypothetical protein